VEQQDVLDQERELRLPSFGHADAWRLGCLLVERATERQLPVAIAVDLGEQHVFRCGLPGSSADNDAWLTRKAATVRRWGHASHWMSLRTTDTPDAYTRLGVSQEVYAFAGGAFPLAVGGALVGVVGVSGLPQADDHALVVEALRGFLTA
jgi:uncharacterized protein (UPF0303 family)